MKRQVEFFAFNANTKTGHMQSIKEPFRLTIPEGEEPTAFAFQQVESFKKEFPDWFMIFKVIT